MDHGDCLLLRVKSMRLANCDVLKLERQSSLTLRHDIFEIDEEILSHDNCRFHGDAAVLVFLTKELYYISMLPNYLREWHFHQPRVRHGHN